MKHFIVFAISGLLLATDTFGQQAKLAIIPTKDSLTSIADVFAATLSTNQQLILLDRADIGRALSEQSLATSPGNVAKLGNMLGADGMLFLELIREGNRQALSARLVAVKAGVALRQRTYPWPLDNSMEWSAGAAKQFVPLLPKLLVQPNRALPLSLVNLRASTQSPESQALERDLTKLLQDRLMQEPDIFILERRRMELLLDESHWFVQQSDSFWNGSYVLDGAIDKEGYSPAQVTIDLRLASPAGGNPIEIHSAGARTNLALLADDLAKRILAALKRTPIASKWNPAAEAAEYLDEAKWAFKWGLMREAQSASEASWALGLQTREVAELRVRAWRETGYDRVGGGVDMEKSLVSFGWPDGNQFADLRRAADAYEQGWQRFVAADPKLNPAWLNLGNTLLDDLTQWLRHYYFTPEAREGQREAIAQAKQQASRLCANILAHPDYANIDTNKSIWLAKARGAGFWVETPEQGVAIYREMMNAGIWPHVRLRFVSCFAYQQESEHRFASSGSGGAFDISNPPLTGWTWADRRGWKTVWNQFVNERCASENSMTALEGRYLKCASIWSSEDFEREMYGLLDFIWNKREEIRAAGLDSKLMNDLAPLHGRRGSLAKARAERFETNGWAIFEKRMTNWYQELESSKQLQEALRFFATEPAFNSQAVNGWTQKTWDKQQANTLLPAIQEYKKRVISDQLPFGPRNQAEFWIGQLEAKLKSVITPPPPETPAVAAPPPAASYSINNPPPRPSHRPLPGYELAKEAATNKLTGIQFWSPQPTGLVSVDEVTDFRLSDTLHREGRVWVEADFITGGHFENFAHRILCAIDLKTMRTEFVPLEQRDPWIPSSGQNSFEVYHGSIYRTVGDQLRRYSFGSKKWEALPIPIQAPARLSVVHDKLYLTTSESILELNANGNAKVIASTRRRPAQTPLDTLDGLGAPPLFQGGDKTIRALVASQIWSGSASNGDWKMMFEVPHLFRPTVFLDGAVLFRADKAGRRLYSLSPNIDAPELLLFESASSSVKDVPKWQMPFGIPVIGHSACLDGTNLWVYANLTRLRVEAGRGNFKYEGDPDGLLFCSALGKPWSVFPVSSKLPDLPLVKAVSPRLASRGSQFFDTLLRITPEGLIMFRSDTPGFWFIPRSATSEVLEKR